MKKIKFNTRYFIPVTSSIFYLYYLNKNKIKCDADQQSKRILQEFDNRRKQMNVQTIGTSANKSIWKVMWSIFCHVLRFFQLCFIFSPIIFTLPFYFFKSTRGYWMDLFVHSVERAGVVFIKAFQYMSHRRDIIGPQMAEKFVHLRQNAPQHSFQQTKQSFQKLYGKKLQQVFDQFDTKPLASGSVSQVYKAVYKGQKVVVKVRHPGVDRHIQRDVNLMFFFSRVASIFSKNFQIPVSQTSMKKTLIDQIDFKNQSDNLLIFNQMFKHNNNVSFPLPYTEDTSQAFLIQSFVQGVPITYYQNNKHKLNAAIARLGAMTFFQMLMKNNFIHADCHGGNILVQIRQHTPTFLGQIWDYIKHKVSKMQQKIVASMMQSGMLQKLYVQSKKQQQKIRNLIKSCKQKVQIKLIDVGMVIRLDQNDRHNFINFIKCFLQKDGQKCAQMIYNLSIFNDKKLLEGKLFESYFQQLKNLFSVLKNQTLQELQGVQILINMLGIIRQNSMKLQGQFATLLTNMLVLEAMAKDLDKDINILKCAVPYFKYAQKKKQIEYEPKLGMIA